MRFMLLMIPKGYERAAPGAMPEADAVAAMMAFNRELQEAGVLRGLDGLHPPSMGARVTFANGRPSVTDGPFAEVKEVLGGYWMIEVGSLREAVDWASRCPAGDDETIEVRQVQAFDDFPADVQQAAAGFEAMRRGAAEPRLRDCDAQASVAVRDVAAARRFYETTLGLPLVEAMGDEVLSFASGRTKIVVYRSEHAGSNRATTLNWAVGDALDALVGALKGRGVAFEHYELPGMTHDGDVHVAGDLRVAWCKDPDGNILHLVNR